ncbi:ABC-three component system protein [Acinetobacter bereziniae]|uniref:ABC-three component system protein n=1 Tax=Acinetobacter bereziniae TaxID=106648 RepID=UPI00125FB0D7|nr:ABC-three component system protein [Acinetobacter bereziniae]
MQSEAIKFSDITNADNKEIGFQYQYYYFLYKLLNLKKGQSVGLEVQDDVHSTLNNNEQILFQLKHTVRKNASGQPVALAELDIDLWKTLYNWAKIIVDEADGRAEKNHQIKFVSKTEFHLVTNKSESKANLFLKKIEDYKKQECTIEDALSYISFLYKKTKDEKIKKYINFILTLDFDIQSIFFYKIHLELDQDDLDSLIKESIRDKMIEECRIQEVYERLDSNIRLDNFLNIKQGIKIEIFFEDFYERYRKIFSAARVPLQLSKPFKPILPDNIFSQNFIKQLIAIQAIKGNEMEKAIKYTSQRLKITRFLEEWLQDGDIVYDEINEFHNDVSNKWENEFDHWCDSCDDSEIVKNAKQLLRSLRNIEFTIANNKLNTELSNGELYHLSNENLIGWHRDWKK